MQEKTLVSKQYSLLHAIHSYIYIYIYKRKKLEIHKYFDICYVLYFFIYIMLNLCDIILLTV